MWALLHQKCVVVFVLDPQYLHGVAKSDGDPIRLGRAPLEVVDLRAGVVGKDGVEAAVQRLGHAAQVPDQRLGVVTSRADVARGVRSPSQGVDGRLVPLELRHWEGWEPDVQDDDLG